MNICSDSCCTCYRTGFRHRDIRTTRSPLHPRMTYSQAGNLGSVQSKLVVEVLFGKLVPVLVDTC